MALVGKAALRNGIEIASAYIRLSNPTVVKHYEQVFAQNTAAPAADGDGAFADPAPASDDPEFTWEPRFILFAILSLHNVADATATPSQEQRDMPALEAPEQIECPYDLDGPNPYDQAYVWLKANRFPDAVDA